MALPFTGIGSFSSFALGGKGAYFTVVQDASPELQAMARAYPDYMSRAIRHLAYRVKQELDAAVRRGGVPGESKWPERSRMHIYRRMDYMRRGKYAALALKKTGKKRTTEKSTPDAFNRWKIDGGSGKLRARGAMQGRMEKGIRYKEINAMRVDVGALNPRVAQLLGIAQESREIQITPKMRRAFWAAGVPLKKDKTSIRQPARDLVDAVYAKMEPYFEDIILTRMQSYIDGKSGSRAEVFKLPWQ